MQGLRGPKRVNVQVHQGPRSSAALVVSCGGTLAREMRGKRVQGLVWLHLPHGSKRMLSSCTSRACMTSCRLSDVCVSAKNQRCSNHTERRCATQLLFSLWIEHDRTTYIYIIYIPSAGGGPYTTRATQFVTPPRRPEERVEERLVPVFWTALP